MNSGVEEVPEGDPLRQISIEFLDGELRKFHVIDGEGVTKVIYLAVGAVGGRVNAGSVKSVGGGKVGHHTFW